MRNFEKVYEQKNKKELLTEKIQDYIKNGGALVNLIDPIDEIYTKEHKGKICNAKMIGNEYKVKISWGSVKDTVILNCNCHIGLDKDELDDFITVLQEFRNAME